MKKISSLLVLALVLISVYPVCNAQTSYINNFDSDVFTWTKTSGGVGNTITMSNAGGEGYNNTGAKLMTFSHLNPNGPTQTWSDKIIAAFPASWNLSGFENAKITFKAKVKSATQEVSTFSMEFFDNIGTGTKKFTYTFSLSGNNWNTCSVLAKDLPSVKSFVLSDSSGNKGELLLDDFEISIITYQDGIYKNDFDPEMFTWTNSPGGSGNTIKMSDAISGGYNNTNAKLMTYSHLNSDSNKTWTDGNFVFFPSNWDFTNYQYAKLNFKAKIKNSTVSSVPMKFEFGTSASTSGNTVIFTAPFTVTETEWQSFSILLTDLPLTKNFNLTDNAGGSTGEILFDDFEIAAISKSDYSYNNNFDPTAFGSKGKWDGTASSDGAYKDYVDANVVSGEGIGGSDCLKVDYSAATVYNGEAFVNFSTDWKIKNTDYLEFYVKSDKPEAIRLGLYSGTTASINADYTYTLNVIGNDWQLVSIPISEFKEGSEACDKSIVNGISFFNVNSGSITQAAGKLMTGDELREKANTGYILIDNLSFNNAPAPTPRASAIKLIQIVNSKEAVISSINSANAGAFNLRVYLENNTVEPTAIMALYKGDRLTNIFVSNDTENDGIVNINGSFSPKPANSRAQIFIWDGIDSLKPFGNGYIPYEYN